MPTVITTTTLANGHTMEITQDPGGMFPFTLDCGWQGNGFKQFIELPRVYKTARGARQAAALLAGEPLAWEAPRSEQIQTKGR